MIRKYRFHFNIRAISKDNEKIMNRSGRFFLSKKYKDFEEDLRRCFLAQRPPDFKRFETEDLCVTITYTFTNRRHCDCFNLPKSTCDAFNKILWKNDNQIKSGSSDINYGDKDSIVLEVFNIEGSSTLAPYDN